MMEPLVGYVAFIIILTLLGFLAGYSLGKAKAYQEWYDYKKHRGSSGT